MSSDPSPVYDGNGLVRVFGRATEIVMEYEMHPLFGVGWGGRKVRNESNYAMTARWEPRPQQRLASITGNAVLERSIRSSEVGCLAEAALPYF